MFDRRFDRREKKWKPHHLAFLEDLVRCFQVNSSNLQNIPQTKSYFLSCCRLKNVDGYLQLSKYVLLDVRLSAFRAPITVRIKCKAYSQYDSFYLIRTRYGKRWLHKQIYTNYPVKSRELLRKEFPAHAPHSGVNILSDQHKQIH